MIFYCMWNKQTENESGLKRFNIQRSSFLMMCACVFRVNNGASEEGRQTTYTIDTAFQMNINKNNWFVQDLSPTDLLCGLFNVNIAAYFYLLDYLIYFYCKIFFVQSIPKKKKIYNSIIEKCHCDGKEGKIALVSLVNCFGSNFKILYAVFFLWKYLY